MLKEKRFSPKNTLDKKSKKDIENRIAEILSSRKDIVFAYLFGSFIQEKSFRDIDIAIYAKENQSFDFESSLCAELTDDTGFDVEVKILNKAPSDFQMTAISKGKLLFCRDEEIREDFIEQVSLGYREYAHFRNVFMKREETLAVALLNKDRIASNKSDILAAKSEISNIISASKEDFLSEIKNILSLKYLIIQAVESLTDTCQHILAKTKGIVCKGYVDCVVKAEEHGLISLSLANRLRKLADLRNNLIHRYWKINDEELYSLSKENISGLEEFVRQVEEFIAKSSAE